jgi:hypothetical protein
LHFAAVVSVGRSRPDQRMPAVDFNKRKVSPFHNDFIVRRDRVNKELVRAIMIVIASENLISAR